MNDTAAAILKATAALRDGTEKLRFEAPVHVTESSTLPPPLFL